jgi:hypothetical protein
MSTSADMVYGGARSDNVKLTWGTTDATNVSYSLVDSENYTPLWTQKTITQGMRFLFALYYDLQPISITQQDIIN